MPYAIIADWDASGPVKRVTRYNLVETESEAQRLVDRLKGLDPPQARIDEMQAIIDEPGTTLGRRAWARKEQVALPPAKQAPNAYYIIMPPPPAGTALFQHRARFWVADPVGGTVSFDTAACHAWQSDIHKRVIDLEADRRIDEVWSPGAPARAKRRITELAPGTERVALEVRTTTLRGDAQTLKTSLAALNPEQVMAVDVLDNAHWSE